MWRLERSFVAARNQELDALCQSSIAGEWKLWFDYDLPLALCIEYCRLEKAVNLSLCHSQAQAPAAVDDSKKLAIAADVLAQM